MGLNGILTGKSTGLKILFLILLCFSSLCVSFFIGAVTVNWFFDYSFFSSGGDLGLDNPANAPAVKYLQLVQSIGLFILPALLFPYFMGEKTKEYLAITKYKNVLLLAVVVAIVINISPIIEYLGHLNEQIKFPAYLSGLEQSMRAAEDQAIKITKLFLVMPNLGTMFINLFIIAALPAIGEELLFRGVLQKLFIDLTKNKHWAIWVTAILFSALHMQFFGFFPRMLLGALMGYLFVYSGSIWVPIFAHFVNNALVVIGSYLFQRGILTTDILNDETLFTTGELILSLAVCTLLFYYFYKRSVATNTVLN